jgi:hypothetical protein
VLPAVPWLPLLGAAVLALCLGILLFEVRLAALGYQPTARDTPARWIAERTRAARLGERALILVGASRFQVGLDLDALRRETGLEPVQLAIDGSAGGAVLENLVRDPAIRGTILLDYYGYGLGSDGVAAKWVRQYEQRNGRIAWLEHPAAASEAFLDDWLREHLRLYADGANPLHSLRFRVLADKPSAQYLVMRPDRARLADYTRTAMPAAYYSRVARTLGESVDPASPQAEALLAERIARLAPADPAPLDAAGAALAKMAAALQVRGGRLVMVAMPTSGMVREIEERRYPRTHFWQRLAAESGVAGIDARHDPGFGAYQCPDGSHLDRRDRERFARELAAALRQRGIGRP